MHMNKQQKLFQSTLGAILDPDRRSTGTPNDEEDDVDPGWPRYPLVTR